MNQQDPTLELEPELRQALADFRQGVDSWADAVAASPQTIRHTSPRLGWRLAIGSAVAVLALGMTTFVGLTLHRAGGHGATARMGLAGQPAASSPAGTEAGVQVAGPAMKNTDEARLVAAGRDVAAIEEQMAASESGDEASSADQTMSSDAQLMATVSNDLVRRVPSAMEPLAELGENSSAE